MLDVLAGVLVLAVFVLIVRAMDSGNLNPIFKDKENK